MDAHENNARRLASLDRVRNTVATRSRLVSLGKAIEALKAGPMTMMEISTVLEFSPSGTRKYIRDLADYGMLEVVPKLSKTSCDTFKLVANEEAVETFLEHIRKNDSLIPTKKTADDRKKQYNSRFAGRQIYSAHDDQPFKVSSARNAGEGKRDAMVAFLFGSADHHEIVDLPIPEKEQTSAIPA